MRLTPQNALRVNFLIALSGPPVFNKSTMDAVSAASRRRKRTTYGKTSRSASTWNSGNLEALDDDELSISESIITTNASVTQTYPVQKRVTKPNTKPVKKREVKQDLWDVPSSESSEDDVSPVRRITAPKFGGKGKSDKSQDIVMLAPWEKVKAGLASPPRRSEPPKAKEDSLQASGEKQAAHEQAHVIPAGSKIAENQASIASPIQGSPAPSSAAARLQAKRLQSGQSVICKVVEASSKRTVQESSQLEGEPRKRLRSNRLQHENDVPMADVPTCESPEPEDPSVRDPFPGANRRSFATATSKGSKPAAPARARRGKVTTYSSPLKMESAPARLSEMLPVDTDTTDSTRSPSTGTSRSITPQVPNQAFRPSSPQTAIKTNAREKQNQLLAQLLPEEAAVPSPSALKMHTLDIHSVRREPTRTSAASRMLFKSSSDVGRPRTKLVDRLKASAMSSDEDSSEEDDVEVSDVVKNDVEAATAQQTQNESQSPSRRSPNQSQSQSQSQGQIEGQSQSTSASIKPKITYAAAQRTWLQEESFEEELMLDVPTETRSQPMTTTRPVLDTRNSASQKSAFNMEDSDDDEGGAGKLRTIHELRAGGINRRFMDDTGSLLEDISNHSLTARGRRRSALLDLATKLADKSFVAKFYRQGFEQQLLAEFDAQPDDIADFALSVIVIMLMVGDPPEHAAQSLKDSGALALLVRTLDSRTDPRQSARERRNNMSKAAQSDFSRFVDAITDESSIWENTKPASITSRTVSLKALDLLMSRLRRSGDRSEILDDDQVEVVMSSQPEIDAIRDGEVPVNVTLSISVLESLSTTTASLSWPTELTESLRKMLMPLGAVTATTQHLRFLTLRLCLNLTNGNEKNCKIFAQPDTTLALLQSMTSGFELISHDQEETQRTIHLDLLVLSMGIMINLSEQRTSVCEYAASTPPLLSSLVDIFLQGQQRMLLAESEKDGVTNVAFGYLAVVLANICRNRDARKIIASRLPGGKLTNLVDAVHEFVVHHQRVDTLNFAGEEGVRVWSAFTERLGRVLARLMAEAEVDEIDHGR